MVFHKHLVVLAKNMTTCILNEKLNGWFFQNFTDALCGQVSKVVDYECFLNNKGGDTPALLKSKPGLDLHTTGMSPQCIDLCVKNESPVLLGNNFIKEPYDYVQHLYKILIDCSTCYYLQTMGTL